MEVQIIATRRLPEARCASNGRKHGNTGPEQWRSCYLHGNLDRFQVNLAGRREQYKCLWDVSIGDASTTLTAASWPLRPHPATCPRISKMPPISPTGRECLWHWEVTHREADGFRSAGMKSRSSLEMVVISRPSCSGATRMYGDARKSHLGGCWRGSNKMIRRTNSKHQ